MKRYFVSGMVLAVSLLSLLAVFAVAPVSAQTGQINPNTQQEVAQDDSPAPETTTNDQITDTQSEGTPVGALDSPDIARGLCAGANLDVTADCNTPAREGAEADEVLNDLIADVINLFSLVVGVVAVIMIIVGGFRYITSGGDSTNVGNAKNTIMYALIGLVIVALSQWIVRFVLGRVIQ